MWLGSCVGGAAGYCPRVRQVTYYSSTCIVSFYCLATCLLEMKQTYKPRESRKV